jgi:hypothetical protein
VSAPHGRTLFVWQERPYDAWSEGWDAVCVKACDGKAAFAAGVFDWAGNAQAWKAQAGGHQVGVFAYCYPDDGDAIGAVLAEKCPWADYVVLDVEDASGGTWTAANTKAIVDGVRSHLPGIPVGHCTYPTAAQADQHGVQIGVLNQACDFSVPQVYYAYQRGELAQVWQDNVNPMAAVAPEDDSGWLSVATESIHRSSAVFVWRAGMADTRTWAPQIPQPAPPVPPAVTADPLEPTEWGGVPVAVPFVAWDGSGWWMTDMLHRTSLTRDQAWGASNAGFTVRSWPQCAAQTGLVQPS